MGQSDLEKNPEYNKLKKKWKNEEVQTEGVGDFCAIYNDHVGPGINYTFPMCWEDSRNALAHFRFTLIPCELALQCGRYEGYCGTGPFLLLE